MHNNTIRRFDMIEMADIICDEISNEFCRIVRQSSFGEESFKDALYRISKETDSHRQQLACFSIYSCFKEITNQFVSMLMILALQDGIESNSDRSLLNPFITNMQILSDREPVELLLSAMKSVSLCQRFYAAKMLYRLAVTDQISVIELQEYLITVIEDPWSHQKALHRFSKGYLDDELKNLLRQLLFEKVDNRQIPLPPLDIFDKNIPLIIPTGIFSGQSNE
ncbi:unnamed protein product [Rotaria sp. Silwood2]|nr:unnamed protein product [Rotaria sp. Silwood2]CAF4134773.1 unnamed protein product [Rotaria sp. Silwood2]